jgi:hypothetical protein
VLEEVNKLQNSQYLNKFLDFSLSNYIFFYQIYNIILYYGYLLKNSNKVDKVNKF